MNKTKLLMTVLMASLLAFGSGCVAVVVGAAAVTGYAYVSGEIEATETASLTQAWDASLAAMGDLKFTVMNRTKDALEGEIKARDAKDTTIKIQLKYVSKNLTKVQIRVGTFGDEARSQIILGKIREHLQTPSGS
jgi:hypothetical protein